MRDEKVGVKDERVGVRDESGGNGKRRNMHQQNRSCMKCHREIHCCVYYYKAVFG